MILLAYLIILLVAGYCMYSAVKISLNREHHREEKAISNVKIVLFSIISIILIFTLFTYDRSVYIYNFDLKIKYIYFPTDEEKENVKLLENAWSILKFGIFESIIFGIGVGGLISIFLQTIKKSREYSPYVFDIRLVIPFAIILVVGIFIHLLKSQILYAFSFF
jgi:uncharacterized BrkB/YihY/UPF0761 family membrane protein